MGDGESVCVGDGAFGAATVAYAVSCDCSREELQHISEIYFSRLTSAEIFAYRDNGTMVLGLSDLCRPHSPFRSLAPGEVCYGQ